MRRSVLTSLITAGLLFDTAAPIASAQTTHQAQPYQQQKSAQNTGHKSTKKKRVKHALIGGAGGAAAGALIGGGAGAAIGAAAGGTAGALWPVHRH